MAREKAKRVRPSSSFAIATVTRNPHRFDCWLDYYRRLGAAHVFLAVEQTPVVVEYCRAHAPDFVSVSETSAERNPYDSIIDRQERHVNHALAGCEERGIGWLFHVDDDELLHLVEPWEALVQKIPNGADCLVIVNVEAVPDHEASDFTTISRFCVNDDVFLCYVNGKSAGRVGSAKACGCHRYSGEEWGVPLESAMVLHFESCPYVRWRDKFTHYASLQKKMSSIPFEFYVDSILACRKHGSRSGAHSEAQLRAFWRRRKLLHYASRPEAIVTVPHLALQLEPGRVQTRRAGSGAPASAESLRHWGEKRREGLELG